MKAIKQCILYTLSCIPICLILRIMRWKWWERTVTGHKSLFDNSKYPNKSLGIPLKASKKKELKRFLERKKVNRNYRTMWRENLNRWLYMTKGIEICKANEKFYPSNLVWLSVHHTYELQACFKVSQFQACLFIILVLVKYTNKCMLNLRKLYVSKKKYIPNQRYTYF